MKPIRVDFEKKEIVMTKKFAAAAADPHTHEYTTLQDVLNTYEGYRIRLHTIRKNASKECYKGLTYDYMRDFICLREAGTKREELLAELEEMIFISKGHSKGRRYPEIKRWFLNLYEDFEIFGATELEIERMRSRKAEEAVKESKKAKAEHKPAA